MNKDKTSIGDRMKEYENSFRYKLPKRLPAIVRVDGKAFHSYTTRFEKPWDKIIIDAMNYAAESLVKEIQGAKIAYIQSDEISILFTDYEKINTSSWFDKSIQKICSISASIASVYFNEKMSQYEDKIALFDSRCFILPVHEVCNYFIWRQQDAIRNSIMGLSQKYFSHKKLQGVNTTEAKNLLEKEHGVKWSDCLDWQKRGWCVFKARSKDNRTFIKSDKNIPKFSEDREYIEKHLPSGC